MPQTPSKPRTYQQDVSKIAQAVDDALVMTIDKIDHNDHLDLDNILLALAEARAYVVKAQLSATVVDTILIEVKNDRDRVFADELPPYPTPNALPKIKAQGHKKPQYKKGIQALFKGAREFDCPRCDAEAGTNCFKFDGPGAHPKLTTERNDGTFFHHQRQDLAKAHNDRIRKANIIS
jgi:hypothetical protein